MGTEEDVVIATIIPKRVLDESAFQFGEELRALAKPFPKIALDCTGVTDMRGNALGKMLLMQEAVHEFGGQFRVYGVTPTIREVLRITAIDKTVSILSTKEDVLRSFV